MADRPAKYLKMEQVAYLAYQAFEKFQPREELAAVATAIAWAESKGNYNAHNDNYKRGGRDDSYGLWQINMLGSMGDRRRAFFGIKKNEDLFDVNNNANAMLQLWMNKGQSFKDWSTYNLGTHLPFLVQARKAVKNRKPLGASEGREDRAEAVENDPLGFINDILNLPQTIMDFISQGALRVAGFIGGAGLIILAVILVMKRGVK